jgi:hypothetical protein
LEDQVEKSLELGSQTSCHTKQPHFDYHNHLVNIESDSNIFTHSHVQKITANLINQEELTHYSHVV